jgi:hypothetical protein
MRKRINSYLSDSQFAAIGSYSAHWTYLETEIDFTITAMATAVHGSQKMPFPFDDRIKFWEKLIPAYVSTSYAAARYRGVIAVARKAHDNRAKFLHARALGDPKKQTKLICFEHHRHRHGNWRAQPIIISPMRLRMMSRFIAEITYSLISLNRRYLQIQPYALPNTYPAPRRGGRAQVRRGHIQSSVARSRRRLPTHSLQRSES